MIAKVYLILSNLWKFSTLKVCGYVVIFIGVFVEDQTSDAQDAFITEKCCFSDLVSSLNSICACGLTLNPWIVESTQQVVLFAFHVQWIVCPCFQYLETPCVESAVCCRCCHKNKRTWFSSRFFHGHYLVNQK